MRGGRRRASSPPSGWYFGLLSQSLFTVIVAMAVVTTTAMPPTLRWALGRLPLGEEERRRLEREEFEAKGFLSNMELLLIAVDESANGKFASRLAGLIAASKGLPTTVVHAQPADGSAAKQSGHVSGEHAIQVAAQAARVMETEQESGAPAKVSVITRTGDAPAEETVASEARKGYDLLIIGIENVVRKAEFHEDVNRIATEFEGPLAIVAARGAHLERPLQSALNILVPVTGTETSRRGGRGGSPGGRSDGDRAVRFDRKIQEGGAKSSQCPAVAPAARGDPQGRGGDGRPLQRRYSHRCQSRYCRR